jgi:hypothetical protein
MVETLETRATVGGGMAVRSATRAADETGDDQAQPAPSDTQVSAQLAALAARVESMQATLEEVSARTRQLQLVAEDVRFRLFQEQSRKVDAAGPNPAPMRAPHRSVGSGHVRFPRFVLEQRRMPAQEIAADPRPGAIGIVARSKERPETALQFVVFRAVCSASLEAIEHLDGELAQLLGRVVD